MNILNDKSDLTLVSNVETEMVQQEQEEYFLLGTFLRTKGLNLYYYNPANGQLKEATIKYSDTLHLYKMPNGKFITIDWETQKCTIDNRCIYFEALNFKSATAKLRKYRQGLIKELANLRKPNPKGINFF